MSFEQEINEERRSQIMEHFRTEPFDKLTDRIANQSFSLHDQLSDIFTRLNPTLGEANHSITKNDYSNPSLKLGNPFAGLCNVDIDVRRPPLFAFSFPEMFVC